MKHEFEFRGSKAVRPWECKICGLKTVDAMGHGECRGPAVAFSAISRRDYLAGMIAQGVYSQASMTPAEIVSAADRLIAALDYQP